MSKYIDADKLIAEIERREKIIRNSANQISDSEKKTYYSGCADSLLELSPFITSLQQEQPEVELEKEITPSLVENMLCEFGVWSIEDVDSECLADIARHFYELGINAKIESL